MTTDNDPEAKLWLCTASVTVAFYTFGPEPPVQEDLEEFAKMEFDNRVFRPFDSYQASEAVTDDHQPRGGWDSSSLVYGPSDDVTLGECLAVMKRRSK